MNNADQAVSAPNSTNNLFVTCTGSHRCNERICNGQRNVGINKCRTDLREPCLKVCFTDAASSTEPLE
jgi:hypothetical protein